MAMNAMRRSVFGRVAAQRSIDWAAVGAKLSSDGAKSELGRLRAAYGEIQGLSNTYSTPPPPIDFDHYKSKISDSEVVAKFEAEYKNVAYPQCVVDELAEIKSQYDELFEQAETSVSESQARIEALTQMVEQMEAKKTGPGTSLEDIYAMYPELEAEIDEEIANHEWGKDINDDAEIGGPKFEH
eukprot:CAMPEP_0118962278 /NCGR_PEP_ID=MMETSP1173-20130426/677_1 /TAXON_ID=1034831 /ORGANISM="Rhizochromulina marina cf, Strain CCMP1243" /LENGTH=183 /DNA_ID=CAMNT_0006910527 /DNA_START=85 /DNA_END=637 /DNA_ORIENTATION=-